MSAKRTAPYTVDEKTLEAVEKPKDNNDPAPQGEAHAPRTIVKVKKDEAEVKQPEPSEKKEESKGLLFQNLFKNNGVGLFNNSNLFSNPPTADKPDFKASLAATNLKAPNLFNGNGFSAASTGIFAKKDSSEGLFKNSSQGLFKNTGGSIFGFGQGSILPPVKSGGAGEEEEDGDSAELEQKQNMPIDKSKSSGSYEYKQEMKVLFTGHAKKYRKNNGDLIESVEVLVQTKEEANISLLVVRLPATKHPIFTGFIIKGSHVRLINNKQENIQVVAFSVVEGKKPTKDQLKLQFETAEVGKNFQEVVAQLLEHDNNREEGKKEENDEAAKEKAKQEQPSQKKQ